MTEAGLGAAATLASTTGPGFIFWGLFATFGLLVLGYAVWMFAVERRESNLPGTKTDE